MPQGKFLAPFLATEASAGILAMNGASVSATGAAVGGHDVGVCAHEGAVVSASAVTMDTGIDAFLAKSGGVIYATDAVTTNLTGGGVVAVDGATVIADNLSLTGGVEYISASEGSVISCKNGSFLGATSHAVTAESGAQVNIDGSTITGSLYGVRAINGGTVNANTVIATGATSGGYLVTDGGTINATLATGTISQTANTPTEDGIIWQAVAQTAAEAQAVIDLRATGVTSSSVMHALYADGRGIPGPLAAIDAAIDLVVISSGLTLAQVSELIP